MKSANAAIWLWYRGGDFHGFQVQPTSPTVQSCLKGALEQLGIERMPVPSGRTDKGVHARMQVVSLKVPRELDLQLIDQRLPELLPPGLGICGTRPAGPDFHAQWACVGKEYRYRVLLPGADTSVWGPFAWTIHEHHRLSAATPERISELLGRCVGTRDFRAFHESSSALRLRTVSSATLEERPGGLLEVRLRGDRFGRYQVRYLVGSTIAAAAGALSADQLVEGLERATSFPGVKAPALGLTLWEVFYPEPLDPFRVWRSNPPGLPPAPPFV